MESSPSAPHTRQIACAARRLVRRKPSGHQSAQPHRRRDDGKRKRHRRREPGDAQRGGRLLRVPAVMGGIVPGVRVVAKERTFLPTSSAIDDDGIGL